MFLSEKKIPETNYLSEKPQDAFEALNKFEYKHSFGESTSEFYNLEINVVNFEDGEIFLVKGVPVSVIPMNVDFLDRSGKGIVFGGYEREQNEYVKGTRYCMNRKTGIWVIED